MSHTRGTAGAVVLTALLLLGAGTYASRQPLRYWLWKHKIISLDPDTALQVMVDDPQRDSLVLGNTPAALADRFGYTTPVSQASAYAQNCYRNSPYAGSEALMLRNSDWMVLLTHGKVTSLVRVSGC